MSAGCTRTLSPLSVTLACSSASATRSWYLLVLLTSSQISTNAVWPWDLHARFATMSVFVNFAISGSFSGDWNDIHLRSLPTWAQTKKRSCPGDVGEDLVMTLVMVPHEPKTRSLSLLCRSRIEVGSAAVSRKFTKVGEKMLWWHTAGLSCTTAIPAQQKTLVALDAMVLFWGL